MGQASGLVGGLIGAAVGSFAGPYGAQVGWMIGSAAGSYYAYTQQPDTKIEGPKLDDLKVQISSYGATIPYVRGAMRITGNVIDVSDLVPHTQSTTESQGGKGGGPEVTTETTTYTFSIDIGLSNKESLGILKGWANKKLIYDQAAGLQAACISQMRFYPGSETQSVDPFFEALRGTVPAYLGHCHVVLEDFDLTEFGNHPPQFEFLLCADGTTGPGPLVDLGLGGHVAARDAETGYVWSTSQTAGGTVNVWVTNYSTGALVATISDTGSGGNGAMGICYATQQREFWIPRQTGSPEIEIYSGTGLVNVGHMSEAISWFGLARYDSYHDVVWLGQVNISDDIRVYDAPSHGYRNTIALTGSTFGVSEILFLADATTVAVLLHDRVQFIDSVTLALNAYVLTGHSAIAGAAHMTYDSSRGRLIVTGVGAAYVVIDIAALTATDHTVSSATPNDCVWMPTQDRYIFFCQSGTLVHVVNPNTFADENNYNVTGYSAGTPGDFVRVPGDSAYVFHSSGTEAWKIPVGNIITNTGVALDVLVEDICILTSAVSADLNVTDLAGDTVPGYMMATQMTGRAALEPLQQAYFFDGVESDDVLKFVKRGGAIAVTMLQADRAGPGGSTECDLQINRMQESDLPLELDVQYPDLNADYLIGTQYERRITRDAQAINSISLPIAMTATQAKETAIVNLYAAWLRQTYSWTTTRKYAKYEPTDVVYLPTESATYTGLITTKRDNTDGSIEWEAVAEDSTVYSPNAIASEMGYVPATVKIIPSSILRLMDVNLIRDQDEGNGFYGAATWLDPGTGCQLFKSVDNGQTYNALTSFTSAATIGTAQDVLGDWTGGNIFEYTNVVTVLLVTGVLSNATEQEVLNGANTCVLGDEILQFTTAALVATDTYELSGLLRGRRGTEWAISTHAAGERFVLGQVATWRNITQDTAEIGFERKYRAPSFGQKLSAATTVSFTNAAARLKPYSPSYAEAFRDGSNNITLTWIRRTRLDGQWRDNVDVPLGETTELYDIDVYDPTFTNLKRTIANITSESQAYSAAEQTTDGYTPGDPISLRIFQRSSIVGRGYALEAVV